MRNVVITGASGGMGRAMVQRFAEMGYNVFACAKSNKDDFSLFLETVAQRNNVEIFPVYFDLSNPDSIKDGAKQIMQKKKPIDILINNAGVIHNALFMMTPMDTIRQVFEANYFGPLLFTQMMIKLMMRNPAPIKNIVNIASTAGLDCNPGKLTYGGSKSALIAATKSLAYELGDMGIRVNAVAPSMTQTPMLAHDLSVDNQQIEIQKKSIKRLGKVSDVVNAVVFLVSEQSEYITGQILRVDGGIC